LEARGRSADRLRDRAARQRQLEDFKVRELQDHDNPKERGAAKKRRTFKMYD
jgi:hypothetical protein